MNRVAMAWAGLAAAIVVGVFALRQSAEEVKLADSRTRGELRGPGVAEKTPTPELPAVVVSDQEPTLALEAGGTRSRPLGETDEEPVDFERLAATVSLEQIPSALARLSDDETGQNLRAEMLRPQGSPPPPAPRPDVGPGKPPGPNVLRVKPPPLRPPPAGGGAAAGGVEPQRRSSSPRR